MARDAGPGQRTLVNKGICAVEEGDLAAQAGSGGWMGTASAEGRRRAKVERALSNMNSILILVRVSPFFHCSRRRVASRLASGPPFSCSLLSDALATDLHEAALWRG